MEAAFSLHHYSHSELTARSIYPFGTGYLLGTGYRIIPDLEIGLDYQSGFHYEDIRFFKKENSLENNFSLWNLHVKYFLGQNFYTKLGFAKITIDQKVEKIYDDEYQDLLDDKYGFARNKETTGLNIGIGSHIRHVGSSAYFWEVVWQMYSFQSAYDLGIILGYKYFFGESKK
jgi:hypothetical protein